jgi:hypothetical protein
MRPSSLIITENYDRNRWLLLSSAISPRQIYQFFCTISLSISKLLFPDFSWLNSFPVTLSTCLSPLEEQLIWMNNNRSQALEMGKLGRQKISSEFNSEVHYEKIREIYRSFANV